MDKESVVLGCGCEVYGDEAEELKQRFRLLRLLIISTALSMPLLWDLPPRFQFVLATVLQFGPGLYFLRNAIRGLKNRSLGMDLLVALSTTAIYVYSTVVAFTVTENIKLYYLCDGVLISLLLFGRYLESVAIYQSGEAVRGLLRLQPKTAIVLRDELETEIDAAEIVSGDTILLRPGERIPADGKILEGSCLVDESLLSGLGALIASQPSFCQLPTQTRKCFAGRPLLIGLLTGLMPCGSLYAMWLHAVSGGSAAYGAESMLAFALGTAPLLFLFGALGALIPKKWNKYFLKASAVLVTAMGLKMLITGLRML